MKFRGKGGVERLRKTIINNQREAIIALRQRK